MWKHEYAFYNKVQIPSQFFAWHLLWNGKKRHFFKIIMPILFRCVIHMEGYIAHIQPWPVSFKNSTYTQWFYFIVMLFFVLLHEFQSNGSLPCQGGFSHTCTNIFLKEYHNHCLKWVLKGFLSQGIRHPLFFPEMCYSTQWTFAKSDATLLHLFQNTECCIHFKYLHLLRHSMQKQCCIFLKECSTMFK